MKTDSNNAGEIHVATEALRNLNHCAAGELSIADLYSIGSLDRLLHTLPQTLSTVARHVELLADDPTLDHDGSAGTGDPNRTAAERAIAVALNLDRALVDGHALSRAHSDLGTLKRPT